MEHFLTPVCRLPGRPAVHNAVMRIAHGTVAALILASSLAAQSPNPPADIDRESLSRLPVVAREGLDDTGKRIYDFIGGRSGTPPKTGPGGVSLHSPEAAEAIQMLNQALRRTVIGPKYFEISALVAAREFDQQYEWSGHEPTALRSDVGQAVIDAIKYDRDVSGLDEKAATVILMGRQLFRGNHQLSGELWARAVRLFGARGALEISMVMGDYAMAAVMLNAVNQSLPPERKPLLPTEGRP
jgi:4-carboxymuconolactone decarboxylase